MTKEKTKEFIGRHMLIIMLSFFRGDH